MSLDIVFMLIPVRRGELVPNHPNHVTNGVSALYKAEKLSSMHSISLQGNF